ncbi:MAG: LysR family transcriptional regulator [Betaproteobacteria bacterium]|jgi:LysR family transcriptional regulator of abg operon|nr:LysR family transcriptional regulator [Betaproteobacteria bacterium]
MNLRLHQLRALVAVVDHGSIRRAARALHLSQAALTKSLRSLEEDTGVALLVRKSSGVLLTAAGQALLPRAKLIARQLDLAGDELRQSQDIGQGSVCVGLTPFLTLTVLGDAFKAFRKRYPLVQINILEGLVNRVAPALRNGSMDFAIVASSGDVPAAEFASEPWLSYPQTVVVRANHPVLNQLTVTGLAALEWVLPGSPPAYSAHTTPALSPLADMFGKAGHLPPAMVARGDAMAAMALVRHSDVASIFPLPLLAQTESRGIVAVEVSGLSPEDVQLELLSVADVPLTPAGAYFARCLHDASAWQSKSAP